MAALQTLSMCLIVTLLASASASFAPHSVVDGFFPSRSGDFIMRSTHFPKEPVDAAVVMLGDAAKYIHQSKAATLPLKNVADVVARTMGILPPNRDFTPSYIPNVFHRPRANIMINVQSLGFDGVSSLPSMKEAFAASPSMRIGSVSFPNDELAMSTSLAMGTTPSHHGIVARQWQGPAGDMVHAYTGGAESLPVESSVVDIMAQTFDSQSLIVSASGCGQHTRAFSPRSATQRTVAVAYDKQSASNKAVFGNELTSIVLATPVPAVSLPAGLSATEPAVAAFVAELQFAFQLVTALEKNPQLGALVLDDVPDMFTFTFTGLTRIVARYGESSPEYTAAKSLLDSQLAALVARLSALYPGRAMVELVLFGSPKFFASSPQSMASVHAVPAATRASIARVLKLTLADVERTYPSLTASSAVQASTYAVCEVLRASVADELEVFCPSKAQLSEFRFQSLRPLAAGAAASNSTVTAADQQRYQIVLWLSIVLVFTVFAAAYALAFMENKKDTLLYSSFNPGWSKKSR